MTRPPLLLLHGHGGDRHEARAAGTPDGLLDRIAAPLSASGFALLRPDLPGLRIPDQLDAALALAPPVGALGVVGFSQGGLLALEMTAHRPIAALALLNPVLDPQTAFARFYAPKLPPRAFQSDLAALNPRARLDAYAGPALLLRSRADRLAAPERDPENAQFLPGDHCLDAARGPQAIDLAARKIADFMNRTFPARVVD